MPAVLPLKNSDAAVAKSIHTVRQLAYAQEAELLGVSSFPPLLVSAAALQHSHERFLGAFEGSELVAVVSTEDEEGGTLLVSSLVVTPAWQRRGVASALLSEIVTSLEAPAVAVHTAALNSPALALYAKHGFVRERTWVVDQQLELVRLVLRGSSACAAA